MLGTQVWGNCGPDLQVTYSLVREEDEATKWPRQNKEVPCYRSKLPSNVEAEMVDSERGSWVMLGPAFLKVRLPTSSIRSIWELVREANSWACPRLCFHNSSRWCLPKLKNHCFKEKVTWAGKRPQKTHRTFIIKVRGRLSSSSLTLVSWFTPYYLIWLLQQQDWRQRRKAEKA